MVVGGFCCRSSFFTYSVVLFLWDCLQDVEASSGKRVIHKKVGDTVELSSGLPTEGVTMAIWKCGGMTVADKDVGFSKHSPFKDRSQLNAEDFTLTVRKLTLQDSGDFIFVSAINDKQRKSVIITLQVYEPITKQPLLKILNFSREASNKFCTVLLECSSTGNVTFNWTVGSQTQTGPRLHHIMKEEDGEITFTCTVSNHVSEKSAFETIKCSKDNDSSSSSPVNVIVGLFTGVLITLLLVFLLRYMKSKDFCKRVTGSERINQDESQEHVYSSLSHGDACVYETVRTSGDAKPGDDCRDDYEPM
ncbi:unnamed protein product [Oreochromis niloticus]|nr:unnamed protein product [Mustela putorius furo]